MDRYAIFALLPVTGVFFLGLITFSFTRLGKAIARRIEGSGSAAQEERLQQLENELELVRHQLLETQERLDFTERVLARAPAPPELPPG